MPCHLPITSSIQPSSSSSCSRSRSAPSPPAPWSVRSIILGIAVASYLNGVPDRRQRPRPRRRPRHLGAPIGIASGQTVMMRRDADGEVLAAAGWASAFFWVLGMGSRFAFTVWINATAAPTIATFSAQPLDHQRRGVDGGAAGMAVFEVVGRSPLIASAASSSTPAAPRRLSSPEPARRIATDASPLPQPPDASMIRLRIAGLGLIAGRCSRSHHAPGTSRPGARRLGRLSFPAAWPGLDALSGPGATAHPGPVRDGGRRRRASPRRPGGCR